MIFVFYLREKQRKQTKSMTWSAFKWDPKWTQTGFKFHFGVRLNFTTLIEKSVNNTYVNVYLIFSFYHLIIIFLFLSVTRLEIHTSSLIKSERILNTPILRSDTASQITPFPRECFLHHYGGQLKTAVEQEAGEKIDWKR